MYFVLCLFILVVKGKQLFRKPKLFEWRSFIHRKEKTVYGKWLWLHYVGKLILRKTETLRSLTL